MDSPNEVTGPDTRRTPELDGVRGLAFLLVFLVHARPPADSPFGRLVGRYVFWGVTGVDLFFVLSGFLITGILLRTKGQPHYYKRFYARRALRIFPLYYATLLIALVALPLMGEVKRDDPVYRNQAWLWTFTTNISMCFDGSFSAARLQLAHLWSLAIEEQFYLVWPFVVRLLPTRWLSGLCVVLLGVGAAARAAAPALTGHGQAPYFFSLCRFDALAAGALVALAAATVPAWWRAAARRVLGLGSAVALAWLAAIRPSAPGGELYYWTSLNPFAPFAIAGLGCYFVMAATDARRRSPARVALRLWPLRFLGKYSYALYIFHVPVVVLLAPFYPPLAARLGPGALAWCVQLALVGGATLLLAVISWNVLEDPCLRLKDRLFADLPPAVSPNPRRRVVAALFRRLARRPQG